MARTKIGWCRQSGIIYSCEHVVYRCGDYREREYPKACNEKCREGFHKWNCRRYVIKAQRRQAQTRSQIARLSTASMQDGLLSVAGEIYLFSLSTSLRSRKSDSNLRTCIQVIAATANSTPADPELCALKIINTAHTDMTTAHQNIIVRLRSVHLINSGLRKSSTAA
jgi:hypothetical protein